MQFLSTPSARRATHLHLFRQRGEKISIHALREEGDAHFGDLARPDHISIHALREEGDRSSQTGRQPLCDFYPRPPRGGRLMQIGTS